MRPRPRSLLALAAGVAACGTAAASAQAPVDANPCQVPGNDLACPDLVMRQPTELRLEKGGGRSLLRSTNAIINRGRGPLEIRARRQGTVGFTMPARQAIHRRGSGAKLLRPPDGRVHFTYVPNQGRYWKFEDAANFELVRLDETGHKVELVRSSPKIYYCFRDLKKARNPIGSPSRQIYPACSQRGPIKSVMLGTSVGWADIYPAGYDKNWIDVTGLEGCFAYVHIADPEQHFAEEREDNNIGQRTVRLPWKGPGLRGCPQVRPGPPDVR